MSTAIAATVAASVAATVTTSIGTAAASAGAAAAGGGAAGGAAGGAGGAGGGGAAGGMITPLIFGAQRFSLSSGIGVDKSPMQDAVASSMAWTAGDLSIWPSGGGSSRLRALSGTAMLNSTTDSLLVTTSPELFKLLNVLTVAGVQICLVFLVQVALTLAWRRCVNKSYYEEQHRRKSKSFVSTQGSFLSRRSSPTARQRKSEKEHHLSEPSELEPGDSSVAASSTEKRFVPFPTFLVWPSSLLFVITINCSGLTRASVALLAAEAVRPDGERSEGCIVLGCLVLLTMLSVFGLLVIDLVRFRQKHKDTVMWKPSVSAHSFGDVQDPLMLAAAKGRVAVAGSTLLLKQKTMSVLKSSAEGKNNVVDKMADTVVPTCWRGERVTGSSSAALRPSSSDATAVRNTNTRLPPPSRLPPPRGDIVGAEAMQRTCSSSALSVDWPMPSHATSSVAAPVPLQRVKSFAEGRSRATARLARRGLAQRCGGIFALPPSDMAEPSRTERILAAPFALERTSAADAFHQRSASVLFRVHGKNFFTSSYRLLVIGATMSIGALSGFQPLVGTGSAGALIQCGVVVTLQLSLACFCCCCSPDADLVFSKLAGTQFLLEGMSGLVLLISSALPFMSTARLTLQLTSFVFAVSAVFIPIFQLVEQRIITPAAKAVRTNGCNPLVLAGALIVLAAAMPGALTKACKACIGGPDLDNVEPTAADGGEGGGEGGGDAASEGGQAGGSTPPPAPLQRGLTMSDACCGASQQLAILGGRNVAAGNLKVTKVEKKLDQKQAGFTEGALPTRDKFKSLSTRVACRV